jgi:tRNA(Ile)-lysidine synthase
MLANPELPLLQRIGEDAQDKCGLHAGPEPQSGPVLVGVSGGPDSVCLLHVFHRLGYPLVVAHLDHGLRPESAADAEAVRRLAESLGLEPVIERQDAAAAARAEKLSIEEAARNLRYRFLFRVAVSYGAQAVAVAHTANDQVETFLMHLLRGAGLAGLRGMAHRSLPNPWSETIPLARPLLDVWREEIETYLRLHGLPVVQDASNRDYRFYRNRLRGEALPYLDTLNPGVRKRFHQTAGLLRDEDEVIEMVAAEAWQACFAGEASGALAFNARRLRNQPAAVQRRLLRRAAAALRPGLRDLDFAAVQRGIEFIGSPTRTRQTDWIAGLRLEMEGDRLWLAEADVTLPAAEWPQLPPGARLELSIPGEITLPGGWRLRAEPAPLTPALYAHIQSNSDPYQAWLDRAALPETLQVRPRRPGDRFRPLGMGGRSVKLSDFMINTGMPRRARAGWPLVTAGDAIAWAPGYRLAEPFCIQPTSAHGVHLELKPDA